MFEYVKDREAEAKRQMTLYGILFAVALVLSLVAIGIAYA